MIAGAYDWTDDMLKIKSMQKKFRDSFNGTEVGQSRWEISSTGVGMVVAVSDGTLTISTGVSLRPAGLVWSKTPIVIDAFERGALIRPKRGGRFLAIPTGFNAARGFRGRGDKGLRVTPAQMVASGQGFLRPFRSGRGFVWCLPLRQGAGTGRRRRTRLIAGGVAEVGTANRKGREAWARGLLEQGMVPMFLLLPQVKLAKRLDVRGASLCALRRLPRRFVAAWKAEAGRAA